MASQPVIVLVPGLSAASNALRDRLADQLNEYFGHKGREAPAVQEIFWGGLRPSLSDKNWRLQLRGSWGLLRYVVAHWGALSSSWFTTRQKLWTIGGLLVVMSWIVGVSLAFVGALGSEAWDTLGWAALAEVPEEMRGWVVDVSDWLSGLTVFGASLFVIAAAIRSSAGINALVDLVFSMQQYFLGEMKFAGGARRLIDHKLDGQELERQPKKVVLVAHSFGALPAIEALAQRVSGTSYELITLGVPLRLATGCSARIDRAVARLLAQPALRRWHFLYSAQDLLGSAPDGVGEGQPDKLVARDLRFDAGRSAAEIHLAYFEDDELASLIYALAQDEEEETSPPSIAA